jgi:hypothetical protein
MAGGGGAGSDRAATGSGSSRIGAGIDAKKNLQYAVKKSVDMLTAFDKIGGTAEASAETILENSGRIHRVELRQEANAK